jgi:uncharacterized protein
VSHTLHAWADGSGYVTSIFADDMTSEIVGRSAASKKYASTEQLVDEVLQPFGARFNPEQPFRPVVIRPIYDDQDQSTVIVTTADTTYQNTYAWLMTMSSGKVINSTAFYDSITFNELWDSVTP